MLICDTQIIQKLSGNLYFVYQFFGDIKLPVICFVSNTRLSTDINIFIFLTYFVTDIDKMHDLWRSEVSNYYIKSFNSCLLKHLFQFFLPKFLYFFLNITSKLILYKYINSLN